MSDYKPGDTAYLKEAVKGYRHVEIIEETGYKLLVRTSSGMELEVYEDEPED